MSSLQKRWCCATGAKLVICLARIVLWLHPPQKDMTCLTLSRVRLLGIHLLLNPNKNPYLLMRAMTRFVLRRMDLAVTLAQGQLQSLAMEMTLSWCLLCQRLRCRNPSFLLLKRNRTWNLWEILNYHIDQKLNCTEIIAKFNRKSLPSVSYGKVKVTRALLPISLDLLVNRTNTDYLERLHSHTAKLQSDPYIDISPEALDNLLYDYVKRIWPDLMSIVKP